MSRSTNNLNQLCYLQSSLTELVQRTISFVSYMFVNNERNICNDIHKFVLKNVNEFEHGGAVLAACLDVMPAVDLTICRIF